MGQIAVDALQSGLGRPGHRRSTTGEIDQQTYDAWCSSRDLFQQDVRHIGDEELDDILNDQDWLAGKGSSCS